MNNLFRILIIACFVGGGALANSYFNPTVPTKPDYSKSVWKEQQHGHMITPNPAPNAPSTPTPRDTTQWDGV